MGWSGQISEGDFDRKWIQESGFALVEPFGRSSESLWAQIHEQEPSYRATQP